MIKEKAEGLVHGVIAALTIYFFVASQLDHRYFGHVTVALCTLNICLFVLWRKKEPESEEE